MADSKLRIAERSIIGDDQESGTIPFRPNIDVEQSKDQRVDRPDEALRALDRLSITLDDLRREIEDTGDQWPRPAA